MGDTLRREVKLFGVGGLMTIGEGVLELRRRYDMLRDPTEFSYAIRSVLGAPILTLNVMGMFVFDPDRLVYLVQHSDGTLGEVGAGMPPCAVLAGKWELVRIEFSEDLPS